MTLLGTIKKCRVCGKTFSAKWGVSWKQWKKSFWCSRKCFNSTRRERKISHEHKIRISRSLMGRIVSKETRRKISLANTGKTATAITRERLRMSHLGIPNKNKGIKRPTHSGENHWNWKKDRTQIKVGDRFLNDPLQKGWRKAVKNRDGWKCRIANNNCFGKLEAHHILPWSEFPELRYQINNGVTLCHFHHPFKKDEEVKLSPFFQSLVAEVN